MVGSRNGYKEGGVLGKKVPLLGRVIVMLDENDREEKVANRRGQLCVQWSTRLLLDSGYLGGGV